MQENFLRANAATWNLKPTRYAAWGRSAGAHMATILALSGGQSSSVNAVVSYFAPTDLLQLGPAFAFKPPGLPALVAVADGPGQPHANLTGVSSAGEGMGVSREYANSPLDPWPQRVERALSASPVQWASAGDPPVFLLHGTAHTTVPFNQIRRLRDALRLSGVTVTFCEVTALGHVPPDAATSAQARARLLLQLESPPLLVDGFEPR